MHCCLGWHFDSMLWFSVLILADFCTPMIAHTQVAYCNFVHCLVLVWFTITINKNICKNWAKMQGMRVQTERNRTRQGWDKGKKWNAHETTDHSLLHCRNVYVISSFFTLSLNVLKLFCFISSLLMRAKHLIRYSCIIHNTSIGTAIWQCLPPYIIIMVKIN